MSYIYTLILFLMLMRISKIRLFLLHLKDFLKWKYVDFKRNLAKKKSGVREFKEYGLKVYTGRQGSGKTVSLVSRANELRDLYPKALIYSNFAYKYADGQLTSLNDLLTIRNGDDGVVFLIDEIQNEFSSASSKDFPEDLLRTVTMQRKQSIVILATSQVFTRVAKPLREQCFEVIECRTFLGRWTRLKCYDADDYNLMIDNVDPKKRFKVHKKWRMSFIQSDSLRSCYDTYEVVKRLSRNGFVTKSWSR